MLFWFQLGLLWAYTLRCTPIKTHCFLHCFSVVCSLWFHSCFLFLLVCGFCGLSTLATLVSTHHSTERLFILLLRVEEKANQLLVWFCLKGFHWESLVCWDLFLILFWFICLKNQKLDQGFSLGISFYLDFGFKFWKNERKKNKLSMENLDQKFDLKNIKSKIKKTADPQWNPLT